MTTSRNTRQSSDQRAVERYLLEALDDLRNAAAVLRAAESKLLAHLGMPVSPRRDFKEILHAPKCTGPKRPRKRDL
jgi:hypothetical protein